MGKSHKVLVWTKVRLTQFRSEILILPSAQESNINLKIMMKAKEGGIKKEMINEFPINIKLRSCSVTDKNWLMLWNKSSKIELIHSHLKLIFFWSRVQKALKVEMGKRVLKRYIRLQEFGKILLYKKYYRFCPVKNWPFEHYGLKPGFIKSVEFVARSPQSLVLFSWAVLIL